MKMTGPSGASFNRAIRNEFIVDAPVGHVHFSRDLACRKSPTGSLLRQGFGGQAVGAPKSWKIIKNIEKLAFWRPKTLKMAKTSPKSLF